MDDLLKRLGDLANRQADLEDRIETKTKELKELQAQHRKISEDDIPSVLDETGLSEVRLADGSKLIVREDIRVSTTGKWRDAINEWLETSGHDDIIKDELVARFGKGSDEQVRAALKALDEAGISDLDRKRYVNPQTFAALIRELLEDGEDVPLDEIGAFIQRRAKLERA